MHNSVFTVAQIKCPFLNASVLQIYHGIIVSFSNIVFKYFSNVCSGRQNKPQKIQSFLTFQYFQCFGHFKCFARFSYIKVSKQKWSLKILKQSSWRITLHLAHIILEFFLQTLHRPCFSAETCITWSYQTSSRTWLSETQLVRRLLTPSR